MAARLPQTIGRYEIRQRLGEGTFGVVYRAWDPQFQFDVALKLCKPLDDADQSRQAIERFRREARTAAQLQHPHIVPVRDMGTVTIRGRQQPWFVMPFVPGSTLEREQRSGRRFHDADIVHVVSGMARGLQYAHAAGLVHRDIKPANIMLDTRGTPLIADFGMVYLSEASLALSQSGQTLGTPAYMAPEQIHYVPGRIDGRADIYSTGVVLYELLCGALPYSGPPLSVLYQVAQGGPFPRPSQVRAGVHPQLEHICLTAMAHAADSRYRTADDLLAALARFNMPTAGGGPVSTVDSAVVHLPAGGTQMARALATTIDSPPASTFGITTLPTTTGLPPRQPTTRLGTELSGGTAFRWKLLILTVLLLGIVFAALLQLNILAR